MTPAIRPPRHRAPRSALGLVLLAAAAAVPAQDRADLERTRIIGNRELPKVLTIVPWKQPLPGVPQGKPPHSLLDEPLQPLDRAVFRRQVDQGPLLPSAIPPSPLRPAPTGETR